MPASEEVIRPPSEHCQIPNIPHGPHWCPEGMLGDMTVSDLCVGTVPDDSPTDALFGWRADHTTD